MGLRINSNIAALSSYNNLNKTDKAVSSSLEKLSSGYRINRAADDAAGLVVSEGLKSQIGGLTVAARNAQDGVNVAQTADGALSTVTDILQRMRDLAVQASNSGSQDAAATSAAQTEINQLNAELNRISSTTKFGSANLLDGTYGAKYTSTVTGSAVGSGGNSTGPVANSITIASGSITVNGKTVNLTNVAAATGGNGAATAGKFEATTTGKDALQTALNADLAAAGLTGVSASVAVAGATVDVATLTVTLTSSVPDSSSTASVTANANSATLGLTTSSSANATGGAAVKTASSVVKAFQVGANGTANDQIAVSIGKIDSTATGLNTTSVDVTSNAQGAISTIDAALATVNSTRATLGAIQNRFEKTIDNLNTAIQNITASNSAIRDTDMAAEMTKFTKNQVLAQAGTSMLAQANSSTQNILTLLRG